MTFPSAPTAPTAPAAGTDAGLAARAAAANRQLLAHPSIAPLPTSSVHFDLPPALEASEPPEARGDGRDDVRLLVSIGTEAPVHARFRDLPDFLGPDDLVVVNTSATMAASLDAVEPDGHRLEVHLSTRLPSGLWLVEIREPDDRATRPDFDDHADTTLGLGGGATVRILARYRGSRRLWLAVFDTGPLTLDELLAGYGRPIRYGHVPRDWPLEAYQTVFGAIPGSAEMPSASRPFTPEVVEQLTEAGVELATVVLHTGVSSLEGSERPYPEWFEVPEATAQRINAVRRSGGRVVAIGTTVVRAVESSWRPDGASHARSGWTDLVVTPDRGVHLIDGLLTGWHEPEASHLLMLEAIAGPEALQLAYGAAVAEGYLWHEFGDTHLILPAAPADAGDLPGRG
jgi:S-adenosylmethionine:tRNA ribosyltransferase-isomerase